MKTEYMEGSVATREIRLVKLCEDADIDFSKFEKKEYMTIIMNDIKKEYSKPMVKVVPVLPTRVVCASANACDFEWGNQFEDDSD